MLYNTLLQQTSIASANQHCFSKPALLQQTSIASANHIMEVPSTPKRTELTRDQRLQIHTLLEIGWDPPKIAAHLKISQRQVQYAKQHRLIPQKQRCGLKALITTPHRRELIRFIRSSKKTRRMSYQEVAINLNWNVSESSIRKALQKEGLFRRVTRKKSPISEANRVARLQWAWEHLNWTKEMWKTILWTDETWVKAGKHTRVWVTKAAGEAYDLTCIVEKTSRKKGWMFWGSFAGSTKGLDVFWEKEWKSINKKSYSEHIVSLI